jgi:hypothetical protein
LKQPHADTRVLFTLTALPCASNEMLPSVWPAGIGSRIATKKSFHWVQMNDGHSWV